MLKLTLKEELNKSAVHIVPVFDGALEKEVKTIDAEFGKAISSVIELKDFEPKKGALHMVYTGSQDMPRLLLVGLGKKKELNVRGLKRALGAAAIRAQAKKQDKATLLLTEGLVKKFGAKSVGQAVAVAFELANYAYDDLKQKDDQAVLFKSVTVVAAKGVHKSLQAGLTDGQLIAEGANVTRQLGNTPPSIMTPSLLAKETQKVLKGAAKTTVKVLNKAEIKKLGMGCLLGVSQGSELEPKFVIAEYKGGKASEKPTVLVGKGITYDSGGLSLKPSAYMSNMKFDMLGAATVVGIMKAATNLKLKKNIVALIPTCENMPSGSSYRPDDILINMNGKSVLVDNTDAEGRLILSDALSYAHRYEPKEVIDFATLTGACVVAIGQERSGLFSPVQKIADKILASSNEVGEQLWQLPLGEEFSAQMKTPIADIKNVSASRYGGASTAAAFLQFFTKNEEGDAYPWAHIDLSSSYTDRKGKAHIRGGANGVVVQTIIEYLR